MKFENNPYREGMRAFESGKEATDNPYHATSERWFEWADGWKDAEGSERAVLNLLMAIAG